MVCNLSYPKCVYFVCVCTCAIHCRLFAVVCHNECGEAHKCFQCGFPTHNICGIAKEEGYGCGVTCNVSFVVFKIFFFHSFFLDNYRIA